MSLEKYQTILFSAQWIILQLFTRYDGAKYRWKIYFFIYSKIMQGSKRSESIAKRKVI